MESAQPPGHRGFPPTCHLGHQLPMATCQSGSSRDNSLGSFLAGEQVLWAVQSVAERWVTVKSVGQGRSWGHCSEGENWWGVEGKTWSFGKTEELWFEQWVTAQTAMELGSSSTAYKRSGGRDYAHLLPEVDAVVLDCLSSTQFLAFKMNNSSKIWNYFYLGSGGN